MFVFNDPEETLSIMNFASVEETEIGVWLTEPIWRSVLDVLP